MSVVAPYLPGARVLDLFAGSGALGLEALSRGAERAVFVEQAPAALAVLRANLQALDAEDRAEVVRTDAVKYAAALDAGAFDVAFADPPYDFTDWSRLLDRLRAGLLVAEAALEVDAQPPWERRRVKRYGRTWVTFLERDAP